MSSSALALLLAGFCAATGFLDANDGLRFVIDRERKREAEGLVEGICM